MTNSKRVAKAIQKLPTTVIDSLIALQRDMEMGGLVRGNWPNYSKLGSGRHHCHLRKGRPTYVAVWEEDDAAINLIEVTYVGTHEKAPY